MPQDFTQTHYFLHVFGNTVNLYCPIAFFLLNNECISFIKETLFVGWCIMKWESCYLICISSYFVWPYILFKWNILELLFHRNRSGTRSSWIPLGKTHLNSSPNSLEEEWHTTLLKKMFSCLTYDFLTRSTDLHITQSLKAKLNVSVLKKLGPGILDTTNVPHGHTAAAGNNFFF